MPRKAKIDRPHRLEIMVPESTLTKVRLELYSEAERRVPYGRMSEVITGLLDNWLQERGIQ